MAGTAGDTLGRSAIDTLETGRVAGLASARRSIEVLADGTPGVVELDGVVEVEVVAE